MQGKTKKELAQALHITAAGLRYRQAKDSDGDFQGEEMKAAASYLQRPMEYLFATEERPVERREDVLQRALQSILA